MAAGINDKFSRTYNAANPNVARVTGTRAAAGASLSCDNLAGWPTDTVVQLSTYSINTSNAVVAGTQIDWKGIVSGNTIGTLTRITGAADTGSAIGDVVEMNPTATWADTLVQGILTHADQDGTLKAGAVDNAAVLANDVVTTAKILDSNVTAAKLATSAITLGYTGITSNFVTAFTVPTQVTGLTSTVTIPSGGRKVKITVFCPDNAVNAVANHYLEIWDGVVGSGTLLQKTQTTSAGTSYHNSVVAMAIVTPSSGSKTYNASFYVSSNTGTLVAAATTPAFILVEAI